MSETGLQLLARYTQKHAEDAFAELVHRHVDLVHSAALRQVRSPQLAEEVAQSVFTDLARTAGKLQADTILTAWLYQVTRRTAIDVVRREARRQLREQIATEMNAMNAPTADWTHIEPFLDEAMSALDETDRAAVLLRYFENKSLREVGATLGTSDDAAQKRVSRAVERLREFFAKRGVTVGEGGLVAVISANAVQAAPIGLAVAISSTAALAGTGTAVVTTATVTAIKTIAMTTLQKTLVTATLAVVAGAGIYEARQTATLRRQIQTLRQQHAPLAGQIEQLQGERDEASHQLAVLRDENERLNRNTAELLKLRNQVSQLKDESKRSQAQSADAEKDTLESEALSLAAKAKVLKQLFEQRPDKKIPELQYLGSQAWLNAAKLADVETESGITKVMSELRRDAKNDFTALGIQPALASYTRANAGQLPTDISQLKPYFVMINPGDDVLQRYQVTRTGNVNDLRSGDIVIAERNPVDEHYDTLFQFGLGTWSYHGIGANTNDGGKAGIWHGPSANQ